MRGLPPWPSDFFRLSLLWVCNAGHLTNDFNIFAPGASGATNVQLSSFISDWYFNALPELLAIVPSNATVAACRLSSTGSVPTTVVQQLAPNAGAFGETSMLNGALCLTWRTSERYVGARSHTLLPLTVELVQADRMTLDSSYYLQAASHAQSYLDAVNALHSPDGALTVAAVVHRSRAGEPLPAATWAPIESGSCSPTIATIGRRVPAGRQPPPF